MYLTDLHVHSDVSADSACSMAEMAAAEADCGVQTLCFTDHCDLLDKHTMSFQPRCLTMLPEAAEKFRALQCSGPLMPEVLLGIELSESTYRPELAQQLAAAEGLDFVLGSVHILPELGDFCQFTYTDEAQCDDLFVRYLDELQRTAELGCFDVMAHIGYCSRYMHRAGIEAALTLEKYGDKIRTLLCTLIDKGKGIEINCSGIRDGCGPFPNAEILKLYRALGGEIVTVGSDAHSTGNAAACIREGHALLRGCGFDYVSVFRQRTPEFIKLNFQSEDIYHDCNRI